MKKIEINLYPYQHKQKDNKFIEATERILSILIMMMVISVILNIFIFLSTFFYYPSYRKANKKWEEALPLANEIALLKKDYQSLREKDARYKELIGDKMDVSHIFADIFRSLPKNIWLEEIYLSADTLKYAGNVVEWKENYSTSINTFIKNLQKEAYFSKIFKQISLKNQKKVELFGRKIMRFDIECKNQN